MPARKKRDLKENEKQFMAQSCYFCQINFRTKLPCIQKI